MNEEIEINIKTALLQSWSSDTCLIFEEKYPYYGQCAQTAIIIFEKFGGEILKTKGWPNDTGYGLHFYNRINGARYDFTAEQFSEISDYTYDLEYQDILSSVNEAETEVYGNQISVLRKTFNKAYGE